MLESTAEDGIKQNRAVMKAQKKAHEAGQDELRQDETRHTR